MEKLTVVLNSHSLSDYQQCPVKWLYSNLVKIEPVEKKSALSRGTVFSQWLRIYYYNKIKFSAMRQYVLFNPLLWVNRFQEEMKCDKNEAFNLFSALVEYSKYYKDEAWKPIYVERGFSKVLYEDDKYLFVYEGRPDLIVEIEEGKRLVVDHKTRSTTQNIYQFNNQILGYLWAGQATEFVYNYLTLTKIPKFDRAAFTFHENQIEDWKYHTLATYRRLANDLADKSFFKTLQCQTKYGVCEYHLICEQPKDSVKFHIIKSNFKHKTYRSW